MLETVWWRLTKDEQMTFYNSNIPMLIKFMTERILNAFTEGTAYINYLVHYYEKAWNCTYITLQCNVLIIVLYNLYFILFIRTGWLEWTNCILQIISFYYTLLTTNYYFFLAASIFNVKNFLWKQLQF